MPTGIRSDIARLMVAGVGLLGAELGCGSSDSSEPGNEGGTSGAGAGGAAGSGARGGRAGAGTGGTAGTRGGTGGAGQANTGGAAARAGSAGAGAEAGTEDAGGQPATGGVNDAGTGGSGTNGAGEGGEGGEACVSRITGQRPMDLFLLVEQTRFLGDPLQVGSGTYFSATTSALSDFVSAADAGGLGVAAGYFPLPAPPDACSADYTSPELGVSLLPDAASALQQAFAAHAPTNDVSAITPALTGAIEFMKTWGAAHPERQPVVVLLATFAEIACTTWDALYAVADAGYLSTPSVPTEVISLLADSSRSLAVASPSGRSPYIIDSQTDVQAAVRAALLDLSNPAKRCRLDYPVFEPPFPFTDTQVSLLYTPNATGIPVELPRVASADACGSEPGWYLEEQLPKTLIACPSSCETFTGGRLSARVDCPP
jgi:hypothetical protein